MFVLVETGFAYVVDSICTGITVKQNTHSVKTIFLLDFFQENVLRADLI